MNIVLEETLRRMHQHLRISMAKLFIAFFGPMLLYIEMNLIHSLQEWGTAQHGCKCAVHNG